MSDEVNDVSNVPNEVNEEPKDITFVITMKPDGHINVNGPLINKPLCLYLIEVGKTLMMNWQPEKPKIQPATGGMMNFARNRMKGK